MKSILSKIFIVVFVLAMVLFIAKCDVSFTQFGGDADPTLYQVQVSGAEGGSASGTGSYKLGDKFIIVATPEEGYEFLHWLHGESVISTKASYEYQLKTRIDIELVAVFKKIITTFNVSLEVPQNGEVTSSTNMAPAGTIVTLRAIADTGYRFAGWMINGQIYIHYSAVLSYPLEKNITVNAIFEKGDYTLVLSRDNMVGTLQAVINGIIYSGQVSVNIGDSVTVRASSGGNTNYIFERWEIVSLGGTIQVYYSYEATIEITGNTTAIAYFTYTGPGPIGPEPVT